MGEERPAARSARATGVTVNCPGGQERPSNSQPRRYRQGGVVNEWSTRDLQNEFSRRVVALVRAQYPNALDPEGTP
jgi:hypothetical protein